MAMRYPQRWLIGVWALVALASGWSYLDADPDEWGPQASPEDLPRLLSEIAGGTRRREMLRADNEATLARIDGKNRVAAEALAGRLTLLEAAARFRDLSPADLPEVVRAQRQGLYPAASEEERYCREVIGWAGAALEARHQPDGGALRRLEAELDEHLRRGPIRLPVAGASGW
jgi:hypothetical protein